MANTPSTTNRLDQLEEDVRALVRDLREHRDLSRDRHQALLDKIDSLSQQGGPPTPKARPLMFGIVPGTAREAASIIAAIGVAAATIAGAYFGARQSTPELMLAPPPQTQTQAVRPEEAP